jgi:hypothetical protein
MPTPESSMVTVPASGSALILISGWTAAAPSSVMDRNRFLSQASAALDTSSVHT